MNTVGHQTPGAVFWIVKTDFKWGKLGTIVRYTTLIPAQERMGAKPIVFLKTWFTTHNLSICR